MKDGSDCKTCGNEHCPAAGDERMKCQGGISLRDWLAGQALVALINTQTGPASKWASDPSLVADAIQNRRRVRSVVPAWASDAYFVADAMIEARKTVSNN